jgi:hypothetical protein
VLVLRDVLGFRASEVAAMLDSSVDSVKAALKRARATLDQRLPSTDREGAPLPDSPAEHELVRRFADALEAERHRHRRRAPHRGRMADDAASTLEYQGRVLIGSFLRDLATWRRGQRYRLVPTRANTQPAFACYRVDPQAPIAHATGLVVLSLRGEQIAAITQFLDTSILARFGFPRTLRGVRQP